MITKRLGSRFATAALLFILWPYPGVALGLTVSGVHASGNVRPGQRDHAHLVLQIANSAPIQFQLTALRLTNLTTGPGTQAQRDAETDSLRLYQDNGDSTFGPGDTYVATGLMVSGHASFGTINVTLGALATTTLLVIGNVPLASRDGDEIHLDIAASSDMTFTPAQLTDNSWPVDPDSRFPIDGMVADQVIVDSIAAGPVESGSRDALVLQARVPSNGYEADVLQGLSVINAGTAQAAVDIAAVHAWADQGDGLFDPANDLPLGTLTFAGGRWQIAGLSEPVPLAGRLLFFSADIAAMPTLGRTLRFGIPTGAGIQMASGNDGPLDHSLMNASQRALVQAPQATMSASGGAGVTVVPGQKGVVLQRLRLASTYPASRTVSRLVVHDATTGPGTADDHDAQVEVLALREDANRNGVLDPSDPVLGLSSVSAGSAVFQGLTWGVLPDSTTDAFLVADVSLQATDGDTVATRVVGPADVSFVEPTTLVASWPLDSSARASVDGMIAAQIVLPPIPSRTLAPGEGPALGLALVVPRNGRADDVLQGIRIRNQGTATLSDLSDVRLWRDGGNGTFDSGAGDDVDLGPLAPSGGDWVSGLLNEGLGAPGVLLFVAVTTTPGASDSSTVLLRVPTLGLQVASNNDGPTDASLTSASGILVIRSPLLVSLEASPSRVSVGQDIALRMGVRNAGSDSLLSVTPSALQLGGTGGASFVNGPSPASTDVAAAAADTLRWTYRAAAPGSLTMSGSAQALHSSDHSSVQALPASSSAIRVDRALAYLDGSASSAIPSLVARGQHDVPAFLLTLANDSDPESAPARVTGIRLRLQDGSGLGIAPSTLLDRIVVSSGSHVYAVQTSFASTGSTVDLGFSVPATIPAGQSLALRLDLDLSPTTAVSSFRVRLEDSTVVHVQDANSGDTTATRLQSGFPFATALARVVSDATELDASAVAGSPIHACPGQTDQLLLSLQLRSPGIDGSTSDVEVLGLSVSIADSAGAAIGPFSNVLSRLVVRGSTVTHASRVLAPGDGAEVLLQLSPPIRIPVNTPVGIEIRGDLAGAAQVGPIRLQLRDSSSVVARDANSHVAVPGVLATTPLPGTRLIVETPAESLQVRTTPRFAASTAIGAPDVRAWTLRLRNAGPPTSASLRLDEIAVRCADDAGVPRVPATVLTRVRVFRDTVAVASVLAGASGDATVVPLPGFVLAPGESLVLDVRADISASAPVGYLQLLSAASDLGAHDVNLNTLVAVGPEPGDSLPIRSGITHLDTPPRELRASLASRMPALIAPDGRPVAAGVLTLRNTAAPGAGAIHVERLVVMASDRNHQPIPLGALVDRVEVRSGGALWASSLALTADSSTATLIAGGPLDVAGGAPAALDLMVVPRPGLSGGSVRIGIDSTGIAVTQPVGGLLQIQVFAEPGQSFPLWTESAEIGATSLARSFINFPNPFAAGREATTLGYYLSDPARVTIRIYSAAGDVVRTLVSGLARPAGMHQDGSWDGRNGAGQTIRNGVYLAELLADYDGGRHERALRKIAVVR